MRTARVRCGFLLLALFAVGAWAAEIGGQWKAEWSDYGARGGDVRRTIFTFKQDGANLTGTVTSESGELPIQEGKVSGDAVSFVVTQKIGNRSLTMTYAGRISGDEIKFKVSFPGSDRSWAMIAKKAP